MTFKHVHPASESPWVFFRGKFLRLTKRQGSIYISQRTMQIFSKPPAPSPNNDQPQKIVPVIYSQHKNKKGIPSLSNDYRESHVRSFFYLEKAASNAGIKV